MTRWARCAGALAFGVLVTASCAGRSASEASTSSTPDIPLSTGGPASCPAAPPPLVVDKIDEALGAIAEGRTDAPRFFEVNATSSVVNLFLAATADDGSSVVIPHSYAAGQLRAEEPTAASGSTFDAEAIRIDPERVLSCVSVELPESQLEAFVVEGGPDGAVRYSVIVNSSQGGQLIVEVSGEGRVLAVDAV